MPRASEDFLGAIHALVGEEIRDMLTDVDPRQRREGVQLALKFLKGQQHHCSTRSICADGQRGQQLAQCC